MALTVGMAELPLLALHLHLEVVVVDMELTTQILQKRVVMEALEVVVATEHLVGHRYQAVLETLADIAPLKAMQVEHQAV